MHNLKIEQGANSSFIKTKKSKFLLERSGIKEQGERWAITLLSQHLHSEKKKETILDTSSILLSSNV